jgi:hypothetical protein
MPTREGEHLRTLLFTGRCTWENQIRRHRNRQNLCDWILGRAGNDVKEKTSALFWVLKPISQNGLAISAEFASLWKTCEKALKCAPVSGLRVRTARAYLPSSPSVVIASGSSGRPIFLAKILMPPNATPATRHMPRMIPASTIMVSMLRANPLTSLTGTF